MSLAVSALSGAALLVLIPEGLGFMECDSEVIVDKNIWICYGIIFFYVLEQGISYFGRVNQENFGFKKQVEVEKQKKAREEKKAESLKRKMARERKDGLLKSFEKIEQEFRVEAS